MDDLAPQPLHRARRWLLLAALMIALAAVTACSATRTPQQRQGLVQAGQGAVAGGAEGFITGGPLGALVGALAGALPGLGLWARESSRHRVTRRQRDELRGAMAQQLGAAPVIAAPGDKPGPLALPPSA